MIKMPNDKKRKYYYQAYNSTTGEEIGTSKTQSGARINGIRHVFFELKMVNEKSEKIHKANPKLFPGIYEPYTPKNNKKYDPHEVRVLRMRDGDFVNTIYDGKKVRNRVYNNDISAADVFKQIRHNQFKREGLRAVRRNRKSKKEDYEFLL